MKTLIWIVGFALASPVFATDGTAEGNGGVALVCRRPNGTIRSAEMLDLYEGRVLPPQLQFQESGLPVGTQVELAQLRMAANANFLQQFREALTHVRAHMVFLPRGVGLPPTPDAFPAIIQRGCTYENVATYRPEGNILVDQEIFDELSPVNQAALYIHEAIYAVARAQVREQSSVRPRKLTAQLLAVNFDSPVIGRLMNDLSVPPAPREAWRNLREGIYSTTFGYCDAQVIRTRNGLRMVSRSRVGGSRCLYEGNVGEYTCLDTICYCSDSRSGCGGVEIEISSSLTFTVSSFREFLFVWNRP